MVNASVLVKLLTDKRFRMDVKAFKSSKPIFEYYAWELLEKVGIDKILIEGATFDKIVAIKKVKNKKMLSNILDLLVGSKYLSFDNGIYKLIKTPTVPPAKNHDYLGKHYPYSTMWAELLRGNAVDSLVNGQFCEKSSFGGGSDTELWDGMMKESPYSFRLHAIKLMVKNLKGNDEVIELGCGTGASLEQILINLKKPIFLTGLDYSESMLKRAKTNFSKFKFKYVDNVVISQNINNMKFVKADVINDKINGQYDAVFMSLILNHIPEEKRIILYKNIKKLIKEDGKLYIYQIVHESKLKRNPIWMMHMVESHVEYPYKDDYIRELKSVFSNVEIIFNGHVIVAKG